MAQPGPVWQTPEEATVSTQKEGVTVVPLGIRINVLVRIFGLVLAAIAVEFIVNGLKLLLPVLVG